MKIIGVIPARYKSSRFPGKPLADIHGRPLIWWVYKQARRVSLFDKIYVATDDNRIKKACDSFDMPSIMTSPKHKTGTDRVGEVADKVKADIYANIQGDEPLLSLSMIRSAVLPLLKSGKIRVTNLMAEIKKTPDLSDSTIPKVVVNAGKKAVFLSRLPIPYPKNRQVQTYYKQICVYGFRREALRKFCALKRGIIESKEDIEILRFIENGIEVHMIKVKGDTVAVDTPADLKKVQKILSKP